jgi:hypothetical protein
MIRPPIKRPASLREVAAESASYPDFGMNLKDFLHEYYRARRENHPLEPMFIDPAPRLAGLFPEGNICDAFLAATADHLSRVNGLHTPLWALKEDLVLKEPWFALPYLTVRMRLLRDTPSAFKDKNLFVFEDALNAT